MIASLARNHRAIRITLVALLLCSASWTQQAAPKTKNTILLLVDGCSTSTLSVARWYRQAVDSIPGNLNMDPYICGLMRTSSASSPVTGSSESMTAIMTGVQTVAGYVSMYPKSGKYGDMFKLDPSRAYQPLATALEAAKVEQGKSTGLVATVQYWHATPSACAAHSKSRGSQLQICTQMASQDIDVVFAGGTSFISDEVRNLLSQEGTTLVCDDLNAFRNSASDKLWATFKPVEMSFDLDRDTLSEPSLAEMTDRAIDILSRNKKGFFLMVEGSKVDYAGHAMDPAAHVHDLLAFDDAVGVALDFAKKDKNTTVIVLTDHGNSCMTMGQSGFSSYVSKPLAMHFGDLPNYKATAQKLSDIILEGDNVDIRSTIKQYTGIDITEEEALELEERRSNRTNDYMKAGYEPTLQGRIAKIMTDRTHLSFASSTHTSEDVFYAVYNPHGYRPEGYITNVEMNRWMCSSMGLKHTLAEDTDSWFVKASKLFAGYNVDYAKDEAGYTVMTVKSDGHVLTVQSDHSTANLDGKAIEVGTVAVWQGGEMYVNSALKKLL